MSRPLDHDLKRPQQRSFPNLNGLYVTARCSGLLTKRGKNLVVDQEMVERWCSLNATERYFAMVDAWLIIGSPEVVGERGEHYLWQLHRFTNFLGKKRTVETDGRRGYFNQSSSQLTATLMHMFGWVNTEYCKPGKGEGVTIGAIDRLPFGDAMMHALITLNSTGKLPYLDENTQPGLLQPFFAPYFPEYRQVLAPPEPEFRDGLFTFRVSLNRAWRRIEAPAQMSLDEFALAILDSVDFDDDHLYCFQVCQKNGRQARIAHPYEDDATAFTDELAVGDLTLEEGNTMTMLFDYGDCWSFDIKLEKIDPTNSRRSRPRVVAEGGQAPEQYGYYDDEDDRM